MVWGGTIKEIHVAGISSPSRRRSVGWLPFSKQFFFVFVVLLGLVLFWFGTERWHVLIYNIPSQRYESGRSSRPASKSLLASVFPSSAIRIFAAAAAAATTTAGGF